MKELSMSESDELEINRLNISIKDILEAHEYLVEWNEDYSMIVKRALISAAIVAYARPFKANRVGHPIGSTAKIDFPENWTFTHGQKSLHELVIALRDQGVAHSDFNSKPSRRIASAAKSIVTWSKSFDVLGHDLDIGLFKELAWQMQCYCVNRMFELRQESPTGLPDDKAIISAGRGELHIRIPLSAFIPPQVVQFAKERKLTGANKTERKGGGEPGEQSIKPT